MSRSNPEHHGTIEDQLQARQTRQKCPVWPFPPAPLVYPCLAPDARPAPREPLPALPDAPF
jgi:hypothetical protein